MHLINKNSVKYSNGKRIDFCHEQTFNLPVSFLIIISGYTIRTYTQLPDNDLRSVKNRPVIRKIDLKNVLSRIQQKNVSRQEANDILVSFSRQQTLHNELLDEIWAALKVKVSPDIDLYNNLLKVYIDKRIDFQPAKLLEEILDASIEPNR